MLTQIAITAIKVPAALVSRSVAQLNDAAEELLDVFSSTGVYLGVRFERERIANVAVVIVMLGTGVFTLFFAVRRFFVPVTPTVTWYPLSVAVVSIPIYLVRSAYERAAGLRGASVALISQSVDSRNHGLVSVGVTVGLISVAVFHVTVLDTLIGLAVALIILKGATVLMVDLIRSARTGDEPELSRYSLWVADKLHAHIDTRIETWLLYLVDQQHVTDRQGLLRRADTALADDTNPLLREYGMELDPHGIVESTLARLTRRGWLTGTDRLAVSDTGRRHLQRALRRQY